MKHDTRVDWHRRVEKAIVLIMTNLNRPLDLDRIAREIASSPYHFHRTFRDLTGETVHGCIRRLRLERAVSRLRGSDGSITDIAFDSGFKTLESFTKVFKKMMGLRPTDVRTAAQWNGLLYSKAGIHYTEAASSRWFYLEHKGDKGMETKIVHLPARTIIGLQNVGDYWGLPRIWERFPTLLQENGIADHAKAWLSLFPDHYRDVPQNQKRSYAAVFVDDELQVSSELAVLDFREGLYAITVHFGSSEEIGATWERWDKEWLPSSGWKPDVDRPSFEWYQNGPPLPPELHLTFLCTPVRKE